MGLQHKILGSKEFKVRQFAVARGKIRRAKTKKQKDAAKNHLQYVRNLLH